MRSRPTRRTFLTGAGALMAWSSLPAHAKTSRLPGIRYGYAAITWGNEERKAIEDIGAVGFAGVQFRANAVTDFKPAELKASLAQHNLSFVALSSGTLSLDAPAGPQIETHVANARFAKEAGAHYLQILDELKGHPRSATPDECTRLAAMLTELGRRTAELGLPLGYHNHLNTLSEKPENLDRILAACDPRYVKLELDTAHLAAGGGDPAASIVKYHDRLLFMHLKDVHPIAMETAGGGKYPFEFVELGRGTIDFNAVFTALEKIRFRGWAVVELDKEPDKSRTARESAQISKDFLQHTIGVAV